MPGLTVTGTDGAREAPVPGGFPDGRLHITQQYDRNTLRVDDRLRCTVTVRHSGEEPVPMALVDLGIPPGFAVETDDFEVLVRSGRIARWERKGSRICVYLRSLESSQPLEISYRLRATMPLRVTVPTAGVYEYYAPENRAEATGAWLEVQPK